MVEMKQIIVNDKKFSGITVHLPKTTLLIISNDVGYIMCGALDVSIFNQPHLQSRKVICARAVGVKTMEELIDGIIESCTDEASKKGIQVGMRVSDALLKLK